jgi:hypothetical protein
MNTNAVCIGAIALVSASAMGEITVSNYDDLSEGFLGQSMSYNGVTYTDLNSVDGVFPDGNTFVAGGDGFDSLGNDLIVESAGDFFDEFPGWGSRNNVLTFGRAFIPGDNLTIGPLSTLTMNLDTLADSASVDLGYFENGPWGGIVIHFDAFLNGSLVAGDSLTIAGIDDRDNGAIATLSVGGGEFDSLQLYATLGNEFTAPRILMDNLTINSVPSPGSMGLLLGAGGLVMRRRR